jgi:hypothetical protein
MITIFTRGKKSKGINGASKNRMSVLKSKTIFGGSVIREGFLTAVGVNLCVYPGQPWRVAPTEDISDS